MSFYDINGSVLNLFAVVFESTLFKCSFKSFVLSVKLFLASVWTEAVPSTTQTMDQIGCKVSNRKFALDKSPFLMTNILSLRKPVNEVTGEVLRTFSSVYMYVTKEGRITDHFL